MPLTLKTTELQYKDSHNVYHGINAVAEKPTADIIADLDAAIEERQDTVDGILDEQETRGTQITSAAQSAVDGIEGQKNTMIASIASVAGMGTDTTLTQSGVAADAKATGDKIGDLKSAFGADIRNLLTINHYEPNYSNFNSTVSKSIRGGGCTNGSNKGHLKSITAKVNKTASGQATVYLFEKYINSVNLPVYKVYDSFTVNVQAVTGGVLTFYNGTDFIYDDVLKENTYIAISANDLVTYYYTDGTKGLAFGTSVNIENEYRAIDIESNYNISIGFTVDNVITDDTLTVSGMAADAKATGDKFDDLTAELDETNDAVANLNNTVGLYEKIATKTRTETGSQGTLLVFDENFSSQNTYKLVIDDLTYTEITKIEVYEYIVASEQDVIKLAEITDFTDIQPIIFVGTDGKKHVNLYVTGSSSDVGSISATLYKIPTSVYRQSIIYKLENGYGKQTIDSVFSTLGKSANKIYITGDSISAGVGGSNFNGSSSGFTPVEETSGELIGTLSFGYGTFYRNTTGTCWANSLKTFMEATYPNTTVINNGCSGINSRVVGADLDILVPNDATIAIIYIGINDRHASANVNEFESRITTIINKLEARNLPYIIITPINASPENDAEAVRNFTSYMVAREILNACATKTEVVDLQSSFQLWMYEHNLTYTNVLADGLHPNDTGYNIMFALLKKLMHL